MKRVMSLIRNGLGRILGLLNWLTRPEPIERSPEQQKEIEEKVEGMSIYQFYGCPFCVKVRRAVHRLNLPIEYHDAQNDNKRRQELKEGGGKIQVPCLRIDRQNQTEWMYESSDIVNFLENKFGQGQQ